MMKRCDNCTGKISGDHSCGVFDEGGRARSYCSQECLEAGENIVKPYDNEILNERESTHGDYSTTAEIAQDLKSIIRGNSQRLNNMQAESLDLIATKIARILSGDPNCKDSWDDIAGYANLNGERLESPNPFSRPVDPV